MPDGGSTLATAIIFVGEVEVANGGVVAANLNAEQVWDDDVATPPCGVTSSYSVSAATTALPQK